MNELIWFIVGLLVGGGIGVTALCCFQINRINYYEQEIHKLREKLKLKNKINTRQ